MSGDVQKTGETVPRAPDLVSYKRLRKASEEIRVAGPPDHWDDRILDPRHEEIHGVVTGFAFILLPWAMLVQIGDSWLKLTHKELLDAFDALDPKTGDEIHIVCLGRAGKEKRRAYEYEVTLGDRVWRDGAVS